MNKIKKGDIVGRISYGKDIAFVVERIIKTRHCKFAILKGLTMRVQADSNLDDLELMEPSQVSNHIKTLEEKVKRRVQGHVQERKNKSHYLFREKAVIYTGKILHIDGDKKYSEKSNRYYKKIGLNAVVKNIPERRQPFYIANLLQKHKPDILVITGHDGMIKKGSNFNDIYNYRNSRYFIRTVEEARKLQLKKDLVIFAGACQSYYEGLMLAGANFASSPARILIDFIDPLIVAEKIAMASEEKFVTIKDIQAELRNGQRGISGTGGQGKKRILWI